MFPHGAPGFALLLLRISVAVILLMNAAKCCGTSSARLSFVGVLLISISLTVGFLTPYLSVIACAFAVANLFTGPHAGDAFNVFPIFDAVVLAVLGPGAYSVDADYLDGVSAFSRPGEILIANLFSVGLSQYRNAVASGLSYGYGSKLLTTTRRYRVTG